MQSREMWMFFLFAILFGLANGGNVVSDSPLVARLFGLKSLGTIIGVSSCSFSIGVAVGPLLTAHLFDSTGSYMGAFITCAAISAVGIVLTSIIRPTKKLQIKL